MSRVAKPWYRKQNKQWYVCINGMQHRLGKNKKAAYQEYHKLMTGGEQVQVQTDAVAHVLDQFLVWASENRAPKTFSWYRDFFQSFLETYPNLTVGDLSPKHVTIWLSKQTTWNNTTKHKAISAMQRAFNWGKRNLGLKMNPIEGMEKPEATPRAQVASHDDIQVIFDNTVGQEFKDIIQFSLECGCRPQESKWLEARHVQFDKSRCVFPAEEAKKKIPRAIYLTETAEEIVKRLTQKHLTGPIFRNTRGNPWTADAIKCRFAQIEKKTGKRFFQYMFRHTWITQKLIAGVDSHVVAALAGHRDTKMIDRVYSHVAEDPEFMLAQARTATSNGAATERQKKS